MKLYNISGRISEGYTKYAGLFLLNDDKLEVIYFLNDDKENVDDFIYEILNAMAIMGKKIFNIIKEFNIEDVEVLMGVDVDISLENWEFEFEEKFIKVIKNAEKESKMKSMELHAKVLQKIDDIEHDYGFTAVLGKYRSEADALLKKEASEEEFQKLIKKVQSCRSRVKKKSWI